MICRLSRSLTSLLPLTALALTSPLFISLGELLLSNYLRVLHHTGLRRHHWSEVDHVSLRINGMLHLGINK